MSLVGPFRMDAIERCPAEPSVRCRVNCPPGMTNKSIPVYGSAWLGLWFDYNVEMAYWPCFVSGHADLAMSLAHGLRAGAAAMGGGAADTRVSSAEGAVKFNASACFAY